MTGRVEFFVSYAGPDRPWAEWVGGQLEAAGCTVELDVWDWAPGDNTVLRMTDALEHADRLVLLYSAAYFERDRFTTDEWTAVMGRRPDDSGHRPLVPLRLADVEPPAILGPLVYADLFDLDEAKAKQALLRAVGKLSASRTGDFPGTPAPASPGPRLPGVPPPVWKVPGRNPSFTGREGHLGQLRQFFQGSDRMAVRALHGMGGVGKTQLAIEYAHLFAGDYDLVWWIDAEQANLVEDQFAELALRAGWATKDTVADAVGGTAVLDHLRQRRGWLLVFDNATTAQEIHPWLPGGQGHVIVTSRSNSTFGVAKALEVDVFRRTESVALLREHVPTLGGPETDQVAAALGDLPLAVAQAAGLLAETGMSSAEYLVELDGHVTELLDENAPVGHEASLAATIRMCTDLLAQREIAAWQLLCVCAALAPEPIPVSWFTGAPDGALPAELAGTVVRPLPFRRVLRRLAELGLARVADTIQLHRLTQAIVRDQRTPADRASDHQLAELLVAGAEPDEPLNRGEDPAHWPVWATLLPHLLHLDPASGSRRLRSLAASALWYLRMRGEYRTGLSLAEAWYEAWRQSDGPDDTYTLAAANQLASLYLAAGNPQRARELDEDSLARERHIHGDDHPNTVISAENLAIDLGELGEHEQARTLLEDSLARRRRLLGDDHPETLRSVHNLAATLWELGEHEQARSLHEDTLARRRRVLGEDHPLTLSTANNLALDLDELGKYEEARRLHEDTVARKRRVLGDSHPSTLSSVRNFAAHLDALGEHERAHRLRGGVFDEPGDG